MNGARGEIAVIALSFVALSFVALATACTGGSGDDTPNSLGVESATSPATSDVTGTTISSDTVGSGDAGQQERLVNVVVNYNKARAACLADPAACLATFDTTVAPYLRGDALTTERSRLERLADQGVRTRGIDPDTMYLQSFRLITADPVDATVGLCVVDTAVQYVPADGSAPEQIVDDDRTTYLLVYALAPDADGTVQIASIAASDVAPLAGDHGACEPYVGQ